MSKEYMVVPEDPLASQLQLNLRTGEVKSVPVMRGLSLAQYFTSLNNLNKTANTYGAVYLATDAALQLLARIDPVNN